MSFYNTDQKISKFLNIFLINGRWVAMKQGRATCITFQSFLVILPYVPGTYNVHRYINGHSSALFGTYTYQNGPRVDFIKVGRKAQNIEIDLSKLGARRKARPMPLKSFSKVGRGARIGCKKFMKSTPNMVRAHT